MELYKFQEEINKNFNILEIERMILLNQNDIFDLFLKIYNPELDEQIIDY